MKLCRMVVGISLLLLPAFLTGQDSKLDWDWRNQEVIGRNDPSIGNTSRLTEAERSTLMDAIVLRLQKPMSDAGYDDDRIREIASTTRIRYVDLGDGQPLLLATSLGLEGGCDAMGNCPLWIFRRSDNEFLPLLTAIAASYTVQPREGDAASDLVLLHHVTPLRSGLKLYHYTDHKLADGGCFEAFWPKPSDDPTQMSDPDIQPCKEERLNEYGLPSVRPLHPHPDEKDAHPVAIVPAPQTPPAAEAPAADQPKAQTPPSEPPAPEAPKSEQAAPSAPGAEQPKESAPQGAPSQGGPGAEPSKEQAPAAEPPAPEAPKSEPAPPPADQKAPDAKEESPKQDQAPPSTTEPAPPSDSAPKAEQPQPTTEPQSPDAGQANPAPKSDQPSEQQPPAEPQPPAEQQPPADQAPKSGPPAPDRQPPAPDTAQPPSTDKPADPTPKQEPSQEAPPGETQQTAPQT